MIKVIIFDFDGVIADSFGLFVEIANEFAEKYGYEKKSYKEALKLRDLSAREVLSELHISPLRFLQLREKAKRKLAERINSVEPAKDIEKLIKELKKSYKIGIITTNYAETVKKFVKHYNLGPFDFIEHEKSVFGKGKKIKQVLEKEKLRADEAVIIEDEARGIDAAKYASVKVIAVTWGYNSKKALKKARPDFIVEKSEEISKIINSFSV